MPRSPLVATAVAVAATQLMPHAGGTRDAFLRECIIGLTAFLTVVDLFATQAILPSLVRHYQVSPAAMGFAVNASTMGMAVAGLAVAFFSRRIDRRLGIAVSLALLAIPTALAGHRAGARHLHRAADHPGHLHGDCVRADACLSGRGIQRLRRRPAAFAAYITGNVASNLIGRLISAALADYLGLAANFYVFALLNLAGAVLVYFTVHRARPMPSCGAAPASPLATWAAHLAQPAAARRLRHRLLHPVRLHRHLHLRQLRADARRRLSLGRHAARASSTSCSCRRSSPRRWPALPCSASASSRHLWAGLGIAGVGLPLLVTPWLPAVLVGLALVGVGTFLAQATATGFVSRAATGDRGSASGIYLASYFCGGLVGSAVLGQVFDRLGWTACVIGIGLSLAAAALLTLRLRMPRHA